jgi:hypothetical protein
MNDAYFQMIQGLLNIPSIQIPHANSRKIDFMGVFRLQMKMIKDMLQTEEKIIATSRKLG